MLNRYRYLLISLLLVAATVAAFWQLKDCDFVNYDDGLYVIENQQVTSGLTWQGLVWSFKTFQAGNWHPLTWLSHLADCELYGLHPAGHHLTNLIFHVINTLLLFLLLARLTGAVWSSAMVAALFALHPLRVESVAWVAERKDVLGTFFWMTTMWAYTWYVAGPSLKRYLLLLLSFALGLMAKPMLVTLPLVLLLLDWWPLGRLRQGPRPLRPPAAGEPPPLPGKTRAALVVEKAPLLVLAALSSVITIMAQRQSLMSLESIPLPFRLANAICSYAAYLGKVLWPAGLAVFYPHPGAGISWWGLAGSGLLLAGGSALALTLARRRPYLAVGWLWYLGTLVPVIGLVQVGAQALADRYTYIPCIGLFIMGVWGARDLTARWAQQKIALGVAAGMVLTVCGLLTWQQVGVWRNSFTLFEHAIRVTENNWLAYTKLGVAYVQRGEAAKAVSLYQKAISLHPGSPVPYHNLGLIFVQQGKYDQAILLFREAIALNPGFAEAYNGLGLAYAHQGKFAEAIPWHQEAIKIGPDLAEAYANLGSAYLNLGRVEEALPALQRALQIQPDLAEACSNLGLAYAHLGQLDAAIPLFQRALALNPHLLAPYNNLGLAYAAQGKTEAAISVLRQALSIHPDNPVAQKMLDQLR